MAMAMAMAELPPSAGSCSSSSSMDDLPDHLLSLLLSLLRDSPADLNAIALASRRFYDLERKQRLSIRLKRGGDGGGDGGGLVISALSSLCARFPHLQRVDIDHAGWTPRSGKQLDDGGLCTIAASCASLRYLGLRFCTYVTDRGLSHVAACKGLEALSLDFVPSITGRGLLSVATGCRSLRSLHIALCLHVSTAEWLGALGALEAMEDLAISQCKGIREADLALLGAMAWRRLKKLHFRVDLHHRYMKRYAEEEAGASERSRNGSASAGDASAGKGKKIIDCHSLEELRLTNCIISSAADRAGLGCILRSSPSLRSLHLDMCLGLRDRDMAALAQVSSGLKRLSLRCPSDFSPSAPGSCSPLLSDRSLIAIAQHCGSLEEVSISFEDSCFPLVPCFSLAGILALLRSCHGSLRSLALDRAVAFDDRGIEALCCSSRSLETLELIQCPQISDDGLQLLRLLPSLKRLRLSKCAGVSGRGLAPFADSCQLQSLRVEDCPKISEQATRGTAKMVLFRCDDLSWLF